MALTNIDQFHYSGGKNIAKIDSPNRSGLAGLINDIIDEANGKGASFDSIDPNLFEGGRGVDNVSSQEGNDLADILNPIITWSNSKGSSIDILAKDYFSANQNIFETNNPKRLDIVMNDIIDGVNAATP